MIRSPSSVWRFHKNPYYDLSWSGYVTTRELILANEARDGCSWLWRYYDGATLNINNHFYAFSWAGVLSALSCRDNQ